MTVAQIVSAFKDKLWAGHFETFGGDAGEQEACLHGFVWRLLLGSETRPDDLREAPWKIYGHNQNLRIAFQMGWYEADRTVEEYLLDDFVSKDMR